MVAEGVDSVPAARVPPRLPRQQQAQVEEGVSVPESGGLAPLVFSAGDPATSVTSQSWRGSSRAT